MYSVIPYKLCGWTQRRSNLVALLSSLLLLLFIIISFAPCAVNSSLSSTESLVSLLKGSVLTNNIHHHLNVLLTTNRIPKDDSSNVLHVLLSSSFYDVVDKSIWLGVGSCTALLLAALVKAVVDLHRCWSERRSAEAYHFTTLAGGPRLAAILSRCSVIYRRFKWSPWNIVGGDVQSMSVGLYPLLYPKGNPLQNMWFRREFLHTPDGGLISLDWLDPQDNVAALIQSKNALHILNEWSVLKRCAKSPVNIVVQNSNVAHSIPMLGPFKRQSKWWSMSRFIYVFQRLLLGIISHILDVVAQLRRKKKVPSPITPGTSHLGCVTAVGDRAASGTSAAEHAAELRELKVNFDHHRLFAQRNVNTPSFDHKMHSEYVPPHVLPMSSSTMQINNNMQPLQGIVVIIPGLSSSSTDTSVRSVALEAVKSGFAAVVINHRGTGDTPMLNTKLYCGGSTEDVKTAIDCISCRFPSVPVACVGLSLGANLLVKYLGEKSPGSGPYYCAEAEDYPKPPSRRDFERQTASRKTPVVAAVSISNPCNLAHAAWFARESAGGMYSRFGCLNMRPIIEENFVSRCPPECTYCARHSSTAHRELHTAAVSIATAAARTDNNIGISSATPLYSHEASASLPKVNLRSKAAKSRSCASSASSTCSTVATNGDAASYRRSSSSTTTNHNRIVSIEGHRYCDAAPPPRVDVLSRRISADCGKSFCTMVSDSTATGSFDSNPNECTTAEADDNTLASYQDHHKCEDSNTEVYSGAATSTMAGVSDMHPVCSGALLFPRIPRVATTHSKELLQGMHLEDAAQRTTESPLTDKEQHHHRRPSRGQIETCTSSTVLPVPDLKAAHITTPLSHAAKLQSGERFASFLNSTFTGVSRTAGGVLCPVGVCLGRVLDTREMDDYDCLCTLPAMNVTDRYTFYDNNSCSRFINGVRVPLLMLHAEDDPVCSVHLIDRTAPVRNPYVALSTTPRGGHCAFLFGPLSNPTFASSLLAVQFLIESLNEAKLAEQTPLCTADRK